MQICSQNLTDIDRQLCYSAMLLEDWARCIESEEMPEVFFFVLLYFKCSVMVLYSKTQYYISIKLVCDSDANVLNNMCKKNPYIVMQLP